MIQPVNITAFDAKNRLGRLLDRVVAGEELVITRHGEPVARLIPIEKGSADQASLALATLRDIRTALTKAGKKITRDEIRAMKNQGRR